MPLNYTQHTLDKLESFLKILNFRVRYEKGNFRTGACLLQHSKIVVVNKFASLESKIISLSELINQFPIEISLLDDKQKQFLSTIQQTELEL